MSGLVSVALPSGLERAGTWRRTATLRPVSGEDEVFLAEEGESLSPAARATALLARCVQRIGDEPCGPDEIRALTVGDREALLLHLRSAVFGERLECLCRCPLEGCGETLEIPLTVRDLLVPQAPSPPNASHEALLHASGASYRVRFRLPTGEAQERAADAALTSEEEGLRALLSSCIEAVSRDDGQPVDDVPVSLAEPLSNLLEQLDPQAETRLEADCPACGRAFATVLDAGEFLFRELGAHGRIFDEIHRLASHYHWSEASLLAMPTQRRRRYLALLAARSE